MKIKIGQIDGLTYYPMGNDIDNYRTEVNSFQEVHKLIYDRYMERMKHKQKPQKEQIIINEKELQKFQEKVADEIIKEIEKALK